MQQKFRPFLALILIIFATYFSSLGNAFIWDDEQFIYRNTFVTTFNLRGLLFESTTSGAGEVSNYYRPLTSISFAIDHLLWGLNPLGFHLTNIGLHIVAASFLYAWLRLLSRRAAQERPWHLQWQWWIAVVFGVHPLQTEAVTYINSRGDSFFAALLMVSIWLAISYWQHRSLDLTLGKHHLNLTPSTLGLLSLFALATSLFTKELAIIGVALLPLTWLQLHLPQVSSWPSLLHKLLKQWWFWLSTVSIGIGYLALRATVFNFVNSFNFYNTTADVYAGSLLVRLSTFTKIFWIYQRLLLVPYPLHMERSTTTLSTLATAWTAAIILLLLVLVALAVYEWRRHHTTWIAFGSLWFAIALAPVSGIIPINGMLYEHWLYIPLIGWALVIWRVFSLIMPRRIIPSLWRAVLITVVVIYCALTVRQNYFWGDPIRFYTYTLRYATAQRLWNNLGMAYADQQQYAQAISAYQTALNLAPNAYPQIYHNLGNTFLQLGRNTEAQASFEKALAVDPNFYFSYPYLINLHLENKTYSAAAPLMKKLVELEPTNLDYQLLYGEILWRAGEKSAATRVLNQLKALPQLSASSKKAIDQLLKEVATGSPSSKQQQ